MGRLGVYRMSLSRIPLDRIRTKFTDMNKTQEERDLDMEYEEKRLWMTIYDAFFRADLNSSSQEV